MAGGPVVLLGCGRLGSAIVEGWLAAGGVDPADLIILTPSEKPVAEAARARGARINPALHALGDARALVLAVKPAMWREATAELPVALSETAAIVSVMAGVRTAALSRTFGERPIARVMPTTGVASGEGIASIWATTPRARSVAHDLFNAIAERVDLDEERLIDAATAVSGSGPAYVHAFTLALASAGMKAGLDEATALRLARGTLRSAAAGTRGDLTLETLVAQVASPGGTTQAGLAALNADRALDDAVEAAVQAALRRARELSAD